MDEERKESGELELSPEEAVRAMLDGETLISHRDGGKVWWDANYGSFLGTVDWHSIVVRTSSFTGLCRIPQKKTRPMDTFECLAWVNSPDSLGWMVSYKHRFDEGWSNWDIPQRLTYSGETPVRRARVLPDKSGIDESTIQGFVVEVE